MTGQAGLSTRWGRAVAVEAPQGGWQGLQVDLGQGPEAAYALTDLVGVIKLSDTVLVNVTAVELGLGTGGSHPVVAVAGREMQRPESGHLLKLRYTPLQFVAGAAEEPDGPAGSALGESAGLEGLPVVAAGLHSQLAPAAAGVKARSGSRTRVAYLMTDGGSLPLALSQSLRRLKEVGLVDVTVTVGQAFGGDIEAVNLYSGLLLARSLGQAEVIIAAMGPGIVGSSSAFGHTGLEQGQIINAVASLGGTAIAIPRLSDADPRPRHRGLSHHTITALGRVALAPAQLILPSEAGERLAALWSALQESGLAARHEVLERSGTAGLSELAARGVTVTSMGRTPAEDPLYFLAAAAAGTRAGELALARRESGE